MLTIGQLAKKIGVNTSALRYYEKEGLIVPDGRSEAGYRLYNEEAIDVVLKIQRAQRLGFSLADIRALFEQTRLNDAEILRTAEARYLEIERQATQLLVLRHEMAHFLQELQERHGSEPQNAFDELVDRVCAHPEEQTSSAFMLDWLLSQNGCRLTTAEGRQILTQLRGAHAHIWQAEEKFHILVIGHDPEVRDALIKLAKIENECATHGQAEIDVIIQDTSEGPQLIVGGSHRFLFARLFLALEQE